MSENRTEPLNFKIEPSLRDAIDDYVDELNRKARKEGKPKTTKHDLIIGPIRRNPRVIALQKKARRNLKK